MNLSEALPKEAWNKNFIYVSDKIQRIDLFRSYISRKFKIVCQILPHYKFLFWDSWII